MPKSKPSERGALVIGGGIAGVQTALDLANQNIKTYIVEKSPSLGGRMAQLDKTFPTNDCSMCILSPKLVEASRHPNIQLIMNSEVIGLKGKAGNFKARVKQHARFVIEDKCTGCGECVKACPVDLPNEFECGMADRKAIYVPYPQAVPLKYTITKRGEPPCRDACPAGINAQGYIALTGAGKYQEALALVTSKTPFPGVLGRICHHPCETSCNRKELDEPVAICELKRFLADYAIEHGIEESFEIAEKQPEKVAIVGAGPAGLAAAANLAKRGYDVTVFEALPVAGGMLAVGIPDYRLPRDVLKAEIAAILKLGVKLKFNTKIGKDISISKLSKQGYQAIFLATGAHISLKLGIPGENFKGVYHGVEFLRDISLDKKPKLGKKVAVIGGGNVAIDSVRTAKRLGAEAFIIYRRSRKEMPAYPWEIAETVEEGIKIHYLATPTKILGKNGKVVGIECINMELGEPDESGRCRPIPIKGSEFTLKVDTVIPAIGQLPDIEYSSNTKDLKFTKWNTLKVNPDTLMTSVKGVFAGGDNVLGPASAIDAMAHGNQAAEAMDRYLKAKTPKKIAAQSRSVVSYEDLSLTQEQLEPQPRNQPPMLSATKRVNNFKELIPTTFSEQSARQEAARCLDCGVCSECLECVKACDELQAIDHKMSDQIMELEVGSVIVATGYDQLDPTGYKEYGYGVYDNVITGLEFERMLSASGPTAGKILSASPERSLSRTPSRIVFVQCVGSRDPKHGMKYCSRVCCMYAIKEALIAKEHESNLKDITILNMDIRAYGKGFDEYYERARGEGVNFIRGRPAEITEDPGTKELNVVVENIESGKIDDIKADLVILCSAIIPSGANSEVAQTLGIELDDCGFFSSGEREQLQSPPNVSQLESTRSGIYLAGCAQGPKDIPDSVAQASGAASKAGKYVKSHRLASKFEKIPQTDISGEPRIGVFVCKCGINIGSVVNVDAVVEYAKTLPDVVFATGNIYTCSDDAQSSIQAQIREHTLNRVIVASCTPRTHEPIFRDTCKKAGLNPYLFEMANIREHCSWVHATRPAEATTKAQDLVRMAVAKSRSLVPLTPMKVPVTKSAIVVGGGIAGMQAALELAEQDFKVDLVEKSNYLGGRLRQLNSISVYNETAIINPAEAEELIRTTAKALKKAGVKVHFNTELQEVQGFVGNFEVQLKTNKKVHEVEVGAIILAIGAETYDPTPIKEYGYGKLPNVYTNLEMEEILRRDSKNSVQSRKSKVKGPFGDSSNPELRNVVMIQCVGARDPSLEGGYPGCARYCCQVTLKQAITLRKTGVDVTVLHRDIRSFGKGTEEMYQLASELGVKFIRFPDNEKPVVKPRSRGKVKKLVVSVFDEYTARNIELPADGVVLAVPMVPRKELQKVQDILKLPSSADGFLLEAHPKLAPVETNTAGIFLAGCVQGPKNITDTLAQASAAASKAATVISKDHIEVEPIVATVDETLCWGCGTCSDVCEFGAPALQSNKEGQKVTNINEVLCKGCGTCVVYCPSGAVTLKQFTKDQINDMIEAFSDEYSDKKKVKAVTSN